MRPQVFVVLLVMSLGACVAGPTPARPHDLQDSSVVLLLKNCLRDRNHFLTCLQEKAVKSWDQALSSNEPLQMLDGIVSFEKDPDAANKTETDLAELTGAAQEELPTDLGARSFKLNDMLWNRVIRFMQTRTLKLTLPLSEEGRGKLKKYAEPLAMALMWKAMMASLAMGALALLAGKALLVSKLALTLSLILAMRRLLSGGGMGMEKIDIYAKHYEDKKHHSGDSSHLYPSLAEPDGYFGQKRSFQPLPPGAADLIAFSSAPAVDVNNNVYTDKDFAQIKASGGRRRGVDIGAVLRKNLLGTVQRLDKEREGAEEESKKKEE